jgi:hypothetical protein
MPLTRVQRHDARDIDPVELTLIRATHDLAVISRDGGRKNGTLERYRDDDRG